MNRRKKITREDATRWNYGYNDKGEVTSGIREKTATPNTAVPGWNHGYSFDEIGNRLGSNTNGRASTYTPNNLNLITSRTVPRAFDVIGKASAAAAVTVNTLAATRLDEYFYKELPAGSGAVHVPYSVAATDGTGTTTRSAGKFLPATPETSIYDFDGNLTSDGRFTYSWDAENRLIAMETLATVPVIARRKLAFAYDAMGRRIRKTTSIGTPTGTWQPQLDLRFLHEPSGWNILAEITADSKFLRTYTWGTDLSGSLSGAGGVGGLLFTKILPDNSIHANGMDLNGNVTLLVSTTTGQATATYDYGPFGEPIRESGEYAKLNPYRFSTKYADDETGLVDYGLRYYGPLDGRWKSRDPIWEEGGENLYGFGNNDGLNKIDSLGMFASDIATTNSVAESQRKNGEIDQDAVNYIIRGNFKGHADFSNFHQLKNPDFDYNRADGDKLKATSKNLGLHFRTKEANFAAARKQIDAANAAQFELELHGVQDFHTHWKKGFRTGHKSPGTIWRKTDMTTLTGYKSVLGGKYYLSPDMDNDAWGNAEIDTKSLLRDWKKKNCVLKSGGIFGLFAKKSWAKRDDVAKSGKCCEDWKPENWE